MSRLRSPAPDLFLPLAGEMILHHAPCDRVLVDRALWEKAAQWLSDGKLTLLALWGEPGLASLAVADAADPARMIVLSIPAPDGVYPSVGRLHPPAIRLERAAHDLFGLSATGSPDPRPWLDHGAWEGRPASEPYVFLPAEGDHLHQVPVGPVHAGIIEPGHFRFTADGETVVRLEERLGYTHRGLEARFIGAELPFAARLAARCSGDSTVAYGLAFCQAVEAALGWRPPSRAVWLRALMAELERLANHFGDVGAICNDAAFAIMLAQCSVLRERVLREAHDSFGHRLMMDRIVPGGVAVDLHRDGAARLVQLTGALHRQFAPLVELYDKTASLQDRTVGTGIVRPALAAQFGAGGPVGRASGQIRDARRTPGYAPYDRLSFTVPVLQEGDVNARIWIRIREIEQSLLLVEQILAGLPSGAISRPFDADAPPAPREGLAIVEGFRGDILAWVRIDGGHRIARCHLRDPSWFQWPLLEAAIEGNIIADFPLCNKSFNCSYAGQDL